MSVVLGETSELEDYITKLYDQFETITLKHLEDLSMEKTCLIAFGFGQNQGSEVFISKLEKHAAKGFDEYQFEDIKLLMHGFIFSYRISPGFLTKLTPKLLSFQNKMSPFEMAKLVRTFYVLEIKDTKLFDTFENHIMASVQNFSQFITDEHLFEIYLTYCMTR
jgi:hypothetical protein